MKRLTFRLVAVSAIAGYLIFVAYFIAWLFDFQDNT